MVTVIVFGGVMLSSIDPTKSLIGVCRDEDTHPSSISACIIYQRLHHLSALGHDPLTTNNISDRRAPADSHEIQELKALQLSQEGGKVGKFLKFF